MTRPCGPTALTTLDPDLARYARIRLPVQLLAGASTAAFLAESVSALAGVLPNAETAVLDGQGHAALMTAPGLIAGGHRGLPHRDGRSPPG